MKISCLVIMLLGILVASGCSSNRIMYKPEPNIPLTSLELSSNTNTYFSTCNKFEWKALVEKNIDSNALVDFGIPGFSQETMKSAKVSLPADKPIIISVHMSTSRLSCTLPFITVLDKGVIYKMNATLNERTKRCRVDLSEIGSDGEKRMVNEKLVLNHTPCNKFISDDNVLERNMKFKEKKKE